MCNLRICNKQFESSVSNAVNEIVFKEKDFTFTSLSRLSAVGKIDSNNISLIWVQKLTFDELIAFEQRTLNISSEFICDIELTKSNVFHTVQTHNCKIEIPGTSFSSNAFIVKDEEKNRERQHQSNAVNQQKQ
jgi:hypothetical protein